ncbi:hypothetical protein N2152v2_002245 [Parachlorella kessleri]
MATREPEGSKRKLEGSEESSKGSKRARDEQQQGAPGETGKLQNGVERQGEQQPAPPSDHPSPGLQQEGFPGPEELLPLGLVHLEATLRGDSDAAAPSGGEPAADGDQALAVRGEELQQVLQADAMEEDRAIDQDDNESDELGLCHHPAQPDKADLSPEPSTLARAAAAVAAVALAAQQAQQAQPCASAQVQAGMQQSELGPQCAVIGAGPALRPASEEPEASCNNRGAGDGGVGEEAEGLAPTAAAITSKQYLTVRDELAAALVRPAASSEQQARQHQPAAAAAATQPQISWDHFPNYLGEGIRSRLLGLATLHLLKPGRYPAAVKEMPSNSNKVLLGGPPSCELYQERIIRALAQKLQVPFLAVDGTTLKLDSSDDSKEEAPPSLSEEMFDRPPGLTDAFDLSDDDEAADKREAGRDLLDTSGMGFSRRAGMSSRRPSLPQPTAPPSQPQATTKKPPTFAIPPTAAQAAGGTAAAAGGPSEMVFPHTAAVDATCATAVAAAAEAAAKAYAQIAERMVASNTCTFRRFCQPPGLEELMTAAAVKGVMSLSSQVRSAAAAGIKQQVPPPAGDGGTTKSRNVAGAAAQGDAAALVAARFSQAAKFVRAATSGLAAPAEAGAGRQDGAVGRMDLLADAAFEPPSPVSPSSPAAATATAAKLRLEVPEPSCAVSTVSAAPGGGAAAAAAPAAATQPRAEPTSVPAIGKAVAAPERAAGAALSAAPAAAAPAPGGSNLARVPSSGPAGAGLKRNARVAYIGKVHPSLLASQERLDAIQAAIRNLESQGATTRLRDYLPSLLLRQRAAMAAAAASKHMVGQQGRVQGSDAPPIGSLGRVAAVSGDKVEVLLDEPFPSGTTPSGGKDKCGFMCSVSELQQVEDKEDPWVSTFRALFDTIKAECEKGPLIVSIQNMDRLIRSQAADHFRKLEAFLAQLPPQCLIFACYCSRTLGREKPGAPGGGGGTMMIGSRLPMELLPSIDEVAGIFDRLGRGPPGKSQKRSSKGKLLAKMFPNSIELFAPNQEAHAKEWRKMVDADVATLRERANRAALRKALSRCGMSCDDMAAVRISDCQLGKKEVEQVVGLAVAEQLAVDSDVEPQQAQKTGKQAAEEAPQPEVSEPHAEAAPQQVVDGGAAEVANVEAEAVAALQPVDGDAAGEAAPMAVDDEAWVLKAEHIAVAADAVKKLQAEAAAQPERKGLQDFTTADQYERQLLTEVIPPEEINVSFDDIGALETVKTVLQEVVILPLQRPELFRRGSLTKPTKGLLLFGPPGTGKTMLAKAVASESGAHFINVNMSAITSKWFGEGERLVRALFSLAHKLAPAVIFIDEIDSFLSKRGQSSNEHEALRKMKNEFMQARVKRHWDGLRTKQEDRVLVLAATNRPMDLDDAVIRRMPRRIMVPLPDAANRAKILQASWFWAWVVLKDEAVEEGFDVEEVAGWTDGYSGSDLKNLCIAAAYFPIRQFLEEEKQRRGAGEAAEAAAGAAGTGQQHVVPVEPKMRSISQADFKEAMKQVTSSVSSEAVSMAELKRWNDQYGEGGSRRTETLHYYT